MPAPGPASPGFPSREHDAALTGRLRAAGFNRSALSTQEWFEWNAYAHAFRIATGGSELSPIDRDGRFFDRRLLETAERYWRGRLVRQRRNLAPPTAEMVADPDLAAVFRRQDDERAALAAAIAGGGRLPNGEPSPAALAFVACCVRQAGVNIEMFAARRPARPRPRPMRDLSGELAALREQLGTTAAAPGDAA